MPSGWVVTVPCTTCFAGRHATWAAAGWVPWSSKKAAERHIKEMAEAGYETDGWQVEEEKA